MPTAINPLGPSFQNSLEVESRPHSCSSTAAFIGKCLLGAGSAIALTGAAVMAYSQISAANHRGDLHSATANLNIAETAFRNMLTKCVDAGARLWRNQCITPKDPQFGRASDCPTIYSNISEAQLELNHAPDTCGKTICDQSDAWCGDIGNGLKLGYAYDNLTIAQDKVQSATDKSTSNNMATLAATVLLSGGGALMVAGAALNRVAVRHQANRMAHEPTGQQV